VRTLIKRRFQSFMWYRVFSLHVRLAKRSRAMNTSFQIGWTGEAVIRNWILTACERRRPKAVRAQLWLYVLLQSFRFNEHSWYGGDIYRPKPVKICFESLGMLCVWRPLRSAILYENTVLCEKKWSARYSDWIHTILACIKKFFNVASGLLQTRKAESPCEHKLFNI
jgi:hypothetical protein